MKRIIATLFLLTALVTTSAQRPRYAKMSPTVKMLCHENNTRSIEAPRHGKSRTMCAFVRVSNDGEKVLRDNGCTPLAQFDDIFIADIPIDNITALSLDNRVMRIECERGSEVLTDTTAKKINVIPVHDGTLLPQAYDGSGVVMGVMDVGFDLTHPNFYDRGMTRYRIKRIWDQLSTDTIGSGLPVGRSYEGETDVVKYAHTRDAYILSHGTHTLGIAAGSGYDTDYRGMAPGCDICLVGNAVGDNAELIDKDDYYKYTFATDALGFKYIFDYAESVGKPCVISFSEGSSEDLMGIDILYNEVLGKLVGQGKIIVSSAGNRGHIKTYFNKPAGTESCGTFVDSYYGNVSFTLSADKDFTLLIKVYHDGIVEKIPISSKDITSAPDSTYYSEADIAGRKYEFNVLAFPSCYDDNKTAYNAMFTADGRFGCDPPVSIEITGKEACVDYYSTSGDLVECDLDPSLNAGENIKNIVSPGSLENVICVGATGYRTEYDNYKGEHITNDMGNNGMRFFASSIGPTMDGHIKPDVMAPGTNIISSYSSYYLEKNADASDIDDDVKHFDYNGRTYAWNCNSGTSMSTPAAAGVIALWLQADPTLTQQDIMEVFSITCRKPDAEMTYPNNYYGYGEIDAYKGLLHILKFDGIEGVSDSQPQKAAISMTGRHTLQIDIKDAKNTDFTVSVYSTSGVRMARESFKNCSSATVDLSSLPHGVYAVQINGKNDGITGSTLVRI